MKTRRGVYYDLTESDYTSAMADTGITFVFSSDFYLTKFEEQVYDHRAEFRTKYNARYGLCINFVVLADIILYKKIEKRGFLLVNERGERLSLNNLKLGGEKVTPKD